jgi:hypothetical protein
MRLMMLVSLVVALAISCGGIAVVDGDPPETREPACPPKAELHDAPCTVVGQICLGLGEGCDLEHCECNGAIFTACGAGCP